MSWIYFISNDNKYRYALGEVRDDTQKLLFCFGINPSTATPEKLDPTARRIQKIALEHGYDSWIILNVCAQRATLPNDMNNTQDLPMHQENLKIITELLNKYVARADILFAYGDLIEKKDYLKKNLCQIINIAKKSGYNERCYCLGKTKSENARHPLYQKTSTPFTPYSLDGHSYSELIVLEDNKCAVRQCSDGGELISEVFGVLKSK